MVKFLLSLQPWLTLAHTKLHGKLTYFGKHCSKHLREAYSLPLAILSIEYVIYIVNKHPKYIDYIGKSKNNNKIKLQEKKKPLFLSMKAQDPIQDCSMQSQVPASLLYYSLPSFPRSHS